MDLSVQMQNPVSYTHLDVYKRQAWIPANRAVCRFQTHRDFFSSRRPRNRARMPVDAPLKSVAAPLATVLTRARA